MQLKDARIADLQYQLGYIQNGFTDLRGKLTLLLPAPKPEHESIVIRFRDLKLVSLYPRIENGGGNRSGGGSASDE